MTTSLLSGLANTFKGLFKPAPSNPAIPSTIQPYKAPNFNNPAEAASVSYKAPGFQQTQQTQPMAGPVAPKTTTTSSGATINRATGGLTTTTPAPTTPVIPTVSSTQNNPVTPPITSSQGNIPTIPATSSPNSYETLIKNYLDLAKPSNAETQTNQDLANLRASLKSAYTNTEGQAIPLEFITGQKKRLQETATDQESNLLNKLAIQQGNRTSAQEAAKYLLEQNKPVSVTAGSELINPLTGEKIASVPKVTEDPNRVLSIEEAKTLGVPYGTTMGEAITQGKTPGQTASGQNGTASTISVLDQLMSRDTDAITGVPSPAAFLPGTEAQKTIDLYDQLKGMLSLENRSQLKGSGAISDFEAKTLEKASGAIGRLQKDTDFRASLEELRVNLVIGQMMKDGIPNDVIEQVVGKKIPFNAVGNTSVSIPKTSRLAYVNNNPGNLKFAGQENAEEGENGFAKFSTPEAGLAALKNQISLDASRGLTLEAFINKYAPTSENNTKQYLTQIANATGSTPSTLISNININSLVAAIAKKESGTKIA